MEIISEQQRKSLEILRSRFENSKQKPPLIPVNPQVIGAPPKSVMLAFFLFGAVASTVYCRSQATDNSQAFSETATHIPGGIDINAMLKTDRSWELIKNSSWSQATTDFSPDGKNWKVLGYLNSYDPELPDSAISSLQTNRTQTIPPVINASNQSLTLARMRIDTLSASANQLIPSLIISNRGSGDNLWLLMLGVKKPFSSTTNAELYLLYVNPQKHPGKRFLYEEKVFDLGREFFTLPEVLTFQAGLYLNKGAKEAAVILPDGKLTSAFPVNPSIPAQPLAVQSVFYRPFSRLNPTGVLAERGILMVYTP